MDNQEFKPISLNVYPLRAVEIKAYQLSRFPPDSYTYLYHCDNWYSFSLYYSISKKYYLHVIFKELWYSFNPSPTVYSCLKNRDLVKLFLSAIALYGYHSRLLTVFFRAGFDYFLVYDKSLFSWLD